MGTRMVVASGILTLIFVATMLQAATRQVSLTWTASTTTGVVGYNIFRATGTNAPVQLNSNLVSGTYYADKSATVGVIYTYTVTAVGPDCATVAAGVPCGSSAPSTPATLTVPPQPAVVMTVTVTVP